MYFFDSVLLYLLSELLALFCWCSYVLRQIRWGSLIRVVWKVLQNIQIFTLNNAKLVLCYTTLVERIQLCKKTKRLTALFKTIWIKFKTIHNVFYICLRTVNCCAENYRASFYPNALTICVAAIAGSDLAPGDSLYDSSDCIAARLSLWPITGCLSLLLIML